MIRLIRGLCYQSAQQKLKSSILKKITYIKMKPIHPKIRHRRGRSHSEVSWNHDPYRALPWYLWFPCDLEIDIFPVVDHFGGILGLDAIIRLRPIATFPSRAKERRPPINLTAHALRPLHGVSVANVMQKNHINTEHYQIVNQYELLPKVDVSPIPKGSCTSKKYLPKK